MSEGGEISTSAATTSEVFERLAPLLLLRTLPLAAWDDDHVISAAAAPAAVVASSASADVVATPSLPDLLLARMLAVAGPTGRKGGSGGRIHVGGHLRVCQGEHDEVRRVAAELHGRVHCDAGAEARMAALTDALAAAAAAAAEVAAGRAIVESRASGLSAAGAAPALAAALARVRACMFACCAALAARGSTALPPPPSPASAPRLRAAAAAVLAWPASDIEVHKAQMGAMETLASLVRAELEQERDTQAEDEPATATATATALTSSAKAAANTRDGDEGVEGADVREPGRHVRTAGGLLEPKPRGSGGDGRLSLMGLYVDPLAGGKGAYTLNSTPCIVHPRRKTLNLVPPILS